jgi:hypothetical protein
VLQLVFDYFYNVLGWAVLNRQREHRKERALEPFALTAIAIVLIAVYKSATTAATSPETLTQSIETPPFPITPPNLGAACGKCHTYLPDLNASPQCAGWAVAADWG